MCNYNANSERNSGTCSLITSKLSFCHYILVFNLIIGKCTIVIAFKNIGLFENGRVSGRLAEEERKKRKKQDSQTIIESKKISLIQEDALCLLRR